MVPCRVLMRGLGKRQRQARCVSIAEYCHRCIPLVRKHPTREEFVDCLVSAAEASAAQGAHEVSHIHQFNSGVASQASVDSPPFKLLFVCRHCSVKVLGKNALTVPWSSPSTSLSEYFSGYPSAYTHQFIGYMEHKVHTSPVQNPLISHMHVGNHEASEQLISEILAHAHREEDCAHALRS